MKKSIYLIFIIIMLFLAIPLYGYAGGRIFVGGHGGGHAWGGHSGHGFYWGGTISLGPWYPWGTWYPYGAWYPYPYYYAGPPVIIQQQPPVYLQKDQSESNYWYYCQNPQGYYPYIKSCPGGWMKVVPETPGQ
jgi:hypothetical protein